MKLDTDVKRFIATILVVAIFASVIGTKLAYYSNEPILSAGETRIFSLDENILQRGNQLLFRGLISNNTVAVFATYTGGSFVNMFIPVGSTFTMSGLTFQVVGVNTSNLTVEVKRIA